MWELVKFKRGLVFSDGMDACSHGNVHAPVNFPTTYSLRKIEKNELGGEDFNVRVSTSLSTSHFLISSNMQRAHSTRLKMFN